MKGVIYIWDTMQDTSATEQAFVQKKMYTRSSTHTHSHTHSHSQTQSHTHSHTQGDEAESSKELLRCSSSPTVYTNTFCAVNPLLQTGGTEGPASI